MKKLMIILTVAVACGILILNCNTPSSSGNTTDEKDTVGPPPPSYTAFPNKFDYPVSSTVIQNWIDSSQMAKIEFHAYNLWAGINQKASNGKLIWQTWYPVSSTMEINPGAGAPATLGKLKRVSNKMLRNFVSAGIVPQDSFCINFPQYPNTNDTDYGFLANNGDIMIAGEYFNYEAYKHIRNNKLYSADHLNSLRKDTSKSPGGYIPPFPSASIILKHMYWPVMQNGYSALPVWDNHAQCGNEQYNGFETWQRMVAIDPTNSGKQGVVNVSYLHLPGYATISGAAKIVPISDFYSWQIDTATWNGLSLNDRRIIDSSFVWAYGRHFQPGDYLVSIAMHIITKEIDNWTMQSFWWHDGVGQSNKSKMQSYNLPLGPWINYNLSTAYNMVTPLESDGLPHIGYNPYIELVVPEKNRIVSNCQNCHARAAYPSSGNIFDPIGQPIQSFAGPDSARYNSSFRGNITPTMSIFKGTAKTDFSWVITDRAH